VCPNRRILIAQKDSDCITRDDWRKYIKVIYAIDFSFNPTAKSCFKGLNIFVRISSAFESPSEV